MRRLLAVTALLWLAAPLSAASINAQAGTSGAQFLKLGAGARAGAMAEAQIAAADDLYAAYYNPAGLTRTLQPQAAGMHDAYFQGIAYDFAALSYPFGADKRHVLAVSVTNLSAGSIDRRTDDTDSSLGQFGVSESAYAASYAYRATDRLSLGGTFKWIRSALDVVSAQAQAVDAGALYRFGDARPIDLGVSVRNMGSGLTWAQGTDPLPLTYGVGVAAHPLKGLTLALDGIKSRDTDLYYNLGVEYRATLSAGVSAAVRGGYTTHYSAATDIKGWTGGFGLAFSRVSLDFAWIPFGDLGNTFKYSLLVRF